jgi:phospholipid/cholesterol/gamma-HCH transport system permease protein
MGAMTAVANPARAETIAEGGDLVVTLGGAWRITGPLPSWRVVRGDRAPRAVRFRVEGLERWDSSLVRFVYEVQNWCGGAKASCDTIALPEAARRLVEQMGQAQEKRATAEHSRNFLATVGLAAIDVRQQIREFASFVGECTLSAIGLVKRPGRFRWRDCFLEMQQCGAMAVPIVSLSSFLVGLTLAYTGAIILRQFGGDIWVADIVGLSTLREMGAVMTGVVLAGRTGAAFAAQLGNMKANEEIDALETLGIAPVDFLVLPRLVALTLMTPLLTMYANCLGIFGGMVVSATVLEIPPSAYWIETQSNIDLSDVSVSLIKSVIFGMLIAVAGCLRGLQAERSAAGVGRAATSAVVTSILLLIVADAVFAVLFNVLGL